MLNNVGVMKKRNPLGGISQYFTSNEEALNLGDSLPVSIKMQKEDRTATLLFPGEDKLYLKFVPDEENYNG
jgi:hypothetical protein